MQIFITSNGVNNFMCKSYVNFQTGEKLDWSKVEQLPDNAMLKVKPELWCEWDFEKNNELGLDIRKATKGMHKNVWWICNCCLSEYDNKITCRINNRGCPYCSGKRVNHTNSLASLNPKLASEWHPVKNKNLTPNDVTCGSNKKVWWLRKCGHEWETSIKRRTVNLENCPYCRGNKRVLRGFNDMWTTNPNLAKQLLNPDDGYKYFQCGHQKVDWKCLNCGSIINESIRNVYRHKLVCHRCSDGFSFGEKILYSVLVQMGIDFEFQKTFKWSMKKRYDFYIPNKKLIIEIHGSQHYQKEALFHKNRTLKEEIENDKFKKLLAKKNDINDYIEIDCKESDFRYIKENILNSSMTSIFNLNNVNWNEVLKDTNNSFMIVCLNHWNNGLKSVSEIVRETKLSESTVRKYLKALTSEGFCDYYTTNDLIKLNRKENSIEFHHTRKIDNV